MSHKLRIEAILNDLDINEPAAPNMRERRRLTIQHLAGTLARGESIQVALGKDRPKGVIGLSSWYNNSKAYNANEMVRAAVEEIRLILHDVYLNELETAEREEWKHKQAEVRERRQKIVNVLLDRTEETLDEMDTADQKGYSVATLVNSALNQSRAEFDDTPEALEKRIFQVIPFSVLSDEELLMIENGASVVDLLKAYFKRISSEVA